MNPFAIFMVTIASSRHEAVYRRKNVPLFQRTPRGILAFLVTEVTLNSIEVLNEVAYLSEHNALCHVYFL